MLGFLDMVRDNGPGGVRALCAPGAISVFFGFRSHGVCQAHWRALASALTFSGADDGLL